jgi:hypothetical protein
MPLFPLRVLCVGAAHYALCYREQEYFLKAFRDDLDLSDHMDDALISMRIVAAEDESFRT